MGRRAGPRDACPGEGRPASFHPILLVSLVYLLIGVNHGAYGFFYDEGLLVYGAERILHGDVPYRDFWTQYAPAQYYLIAGLFELFGPSLLVARLGSVFVAFALCLLVYATAAAWLSRGQALLAWALATIWLGSFRQFSSPIPTALVLVLSSSLCLLRFPSDRRRRWLFLGGVLAAGSGLFRHDLGVYTVLAQSTTVAFCLRGAGTRPLRSLSTYLLGLASGLALPALYFGAAAAPGEVARQLFVFPLTVFPEVRALPFPPPLPLLQHAPFYLPLLVYLAVLIRLCAGREGERRAFTVLFTFLGILFLNQVRIRSDPAHLLPTFVPAILLLGPLVDEIRARAPRRALVASLALALAPCVFVPQVWAQVGRIRETVAPLPSTRFDLDRARGIAHPERERYEEALAHVRDVVPPGERIFVGNGRHDRIYINDVMFYFLSGRGSATRYHELHPGLATTAGVQREIVRELEAHRVGHVVLNDRSHPPEPNASSRSSGVHLLDEYLRREFVPVRTFGTHAVWRRRGSSRDPGG